MEKHVLKRGTTQNQTDIKIICLKYLILLCLTYISTVTTNFIHDQTVLLKLFYTELDHMYLLCSLSFTLIFSIKGLGPY